SANYGAGEPMALAIRASGDLTIKGSISDGFRSALGLPATDPTYTGLVDPGSILGSTFIFTSTIYYTTSWVVPNDDYYNNVALSLYDYNTGIEYLPGSTVPAGAQFRADGWNAFEAGISLPGYATGIIPGTPATPAAPGTSALAAMLASPGA